MAQQVPTDPKNQQELLRQIAAAMGPDGTLVFTLRRGKEYECYQASGMGVCEFLGTHSVAVIQLVEEDSLLLKMIAKSFNMEIERIKAKGLPNGKWINSRYRVLDDVPGKN